MLLVTRETVEVVSVALGEDQQVGVAEQRPTDELVLARSIDEASLGQPRHRPEGAVHVSERTGGQEVFGFDHSGHLRLLVGRGGRCVGLLSFVLFFVRKRASWRRNTIKANKHKHDRYHTSNYSK